MAEKTPMWTDELDELPAGELVTQELWPRLVRGAPVRVVTKGGVIYEGEIGDVGLSGRVISSNAKIAVNGIRFVVAQHDFYLIDPERMTVRNPDPIKLSDEEIRDYVADLGRSKSGGKPESVTPQQIAVKLLGFDPSVYSRSGDSADAAINPFFKLGALRTAMKRLAEEGVLRKVTSGSWSKPSPDDRRVRISGKAGYVTVEAYEEGDRVYADAAREATIAALRAQAIETIAARHADEVEAEVARLATGQGIRL